MEHEFIKWLTGQNHSNNPNGVVQVGIGDDAAILCVGEHGDANTNWVFASDVIAEGTHFLTSEHSLELIGRKALAVNLSDLAAMAAEPVACLLNLQLPREFGLDKAKQLFNGVQQLASQFEMEVIGGDTNRWDGNLVLAVTAIGHQVVKNGWRLKGANVGDQIIVSGSLGGSFLGRHLRFKPRIELARKLAKYNIRAATDISDSLTTDLYHMTTEATGIKIQLNDVPVSKDAKQKSKTSGKTPLEHALGDGEDFELLLAVSTKDANAIVADSSLGVPLTVIGTVIDQPGLWSEDNAGKLNRLTVTGYEH